MNKHTPDETLTLYANRLDEAYAEIERLTKTLSVERDILKQREDQLARLRALLKRARETLRWVMNSPRDANVVTSALLLLTDIQKEGL